MSKCAFWGWVARCPHRRGGTFRAHNGAALIRCGDWPDGLLQAWTSLTRQLQCADLEDQVERQVSHHIRAMPFLWLAVPNRPTGDSDRGYLEMNSIALLSCRTSKLDRPSTGWLGHHANSEKIRQSALWNSNHVDDQYNPDFLPVLAHMVERVQ
jgi:hypothetical protein